MVNIVSHVTMAILLLVASIGCKALAPARPVSKTSQAKEPNGSFAKKVKVRCTQTASTMQQEDKQGPVVSVAWNNVFESSNIQNPLVAHSYTLSDFEGLAMENNPTLAAAAARMQAARGHWTQAGRYPNPVVGYHATEMGIRGTSGQQGGFVNQKWITGGKLCLDQAIAKKQIDEARFQFHAQEQRVLSDVHFRFYDAMVAQRRVELIRKLVDVQDDQVTAIGKLAEGRLKTQHDLLKAEIRADEIHILLSNAVNEQDEAWQRLVTVVGMPRLDWAPLMGELDAKLPNLEENLQDESFLHGHPAVNAARARAERACLAIDRAKREPIPNVDLSVSVRHHNVTQEEIANVQIGFPVPVFDKNQGNIRAAQAEWLVAKKEITQLELQLRDRYAVAYRRYSNARQQAIVYQQRILPKSERSLKLVSEGYHKDQTSYPDLLTAREADIRIKLSYLDILRELRASWSVLEGQLLTDSLATRG